MKSLTATAVSFARLLAGDITTRRKVLGIITLVAAAMLFLGATVLASSLEASPVLFISYWLACLWLVLTLVLLAVYDMLQVFSSGRQARRALEHRMKNVQNSSTKSPSSNTSPNP